MEDLTRKRKKHLISRNNEIIIELENLKLGATKKSDEEMAQKIDGVIFKLLCLTIPSPQEEPKETLEDSAKKYYENNIDASNIPREHYELEIQDLMIGFASEWQLKQL